jgi:DNA-binding transcriptional ArsR family regulator
MPLFRRSDADLVSGESLVRRMMPFLMPTRTESAVYQDTLFEVGPARAWLGRFNASRPGFPHATLYHLFLWSCARALHLRPQLNRFVSGRSLYQRRGVFISFAAKKSFADDAPLVTIKLPFPEHEPFVDCVVRLQGAVARGRNGDGGGNAHREMNLASAMPSSLLRMALWALRLLDRHNLKPRSLIESDPMYASLFTANLGSVGLSAVSHHLYEYGNAGLFAAMGVAGPRLLVANGELIVKDAVDVRWTLDERIADGFYCARSLELVKEPFLEPDRILGKNSHEAPSLRLGLS